MVPPDVTKRWSRVRLPGGRHRPDSGDRLGGPQLPQRPAHSPSSPPSFALLELLAVAAIIILLGAGKLVKRPADPDWVDSTTPEGQAVMTGSLPRCLNGISPQECRP